MALVALVSDVVPLVVPLVHTGLVSILPGTLMKMYFIKYVPKIFEISF